MKGKKSTSWHDIAISAAAAALLGALKDDNDRARKALEILVALDGAETPMFATAITYWVDALRSHMFAGRYIVVKQFGVSTISDGTREYVVGSAEADMEVPPECLWASNVVDARLSHDLDRFVRLWDDAPDDNFGSYLVAVLTCVSETIKCNTRGWALTELRKAE